VISLAASENNQVHQSEYLNFDDAKEFWNKRFDNQEFIFGKEPNEYLVQQAKVYLRPNQKVLCIADGEGRNGVWLAKQGMQVVGFDVSDIALVKAKQFAADNQVEIAYSLSDTDSFDWEENSYDAVIGIFIQFAEPQMRARIFKQAYKALNPGGILILQGYTLKQLEYKTGGPSLKDHLYTEDIIRDLVKEFQILDLRCYEKELNEGARHAGISALLGLVARK
jgi:2-polyprenyl-3-methyl-5-hydroxy-6-metoxy-1,4-benzoquinol methylase